MDYQNQGLNVSEIDGIVIICFTDAWEGVLIVAMSNFSFEFVLREKV